MNDINLIPFSKHEFRNFLKDCVNEVLIDKLLKPPSSNEFEMLTIKEASHYLNLAIQTIYGFTSKNEIPFIKRGKKLYFRKLDLESWLLEGKRKSNTEILKELDK